MSVYQVNKLCRALLHDPPFRAAMQADPAAACADWPLSDAEREALLQGDVATLYRLGVSAFLMGYLPRFGIVGLSLPVYNERMRRVAAGASPTEA